MRISFTAQARAAGTVHDAAAAVGQFQAAHDTAQRIGDAVTQSQGLPLKATEDLQAFIDDLNPQSKGKLPSKLNGQDATIATAGSRQGQQPVPAFARSALVFDAANSLNTATPASTMLYGGESLHWTSQQDWHAAAGRTVAMAAGNSASLYAQRGGLKAIAQAGAVSIQAHQGALEWTAKDKLTVTSSGEDVEVLAQGKITLAAGQVSIVLEGPNITLTMPATLDIKGVTKSFVGPGSSPASLPALPVGLLGVVPRELELHYTYDDLSPVKQATYKVTFDSGEILEGSLDSDGYKLLRGVPATSYVVEYGEDVRPLELPPVSEHDAEFQKAEVQKQGADLIEKALRTEPPLSTNIFPGADA